MSQTHTKSYGSHWHLRPGKYGQLKPASSVQALPSAGSVRGQPGWATLL
jgi:hypothetical protein